jgi:hypothetical protein
MISIFLRKYTTAPKLGFLEKRITNAHQTLENASSIEWCHKLIGIDNMEVIMLDQKQISEISPELPVDPKLNSLKELETIAGQKTRQAVRAIISQWLAMCEGTQIQPETLCRECGLKANYVSQKAAFARTQFGLVRYQRAYYVCPHCHSATCPLDERLNPIASLSRLRKKIATGKSMPVAEMANAWGLGSLV